MAFTVNGELVPADVVRREADRLRQQYYLALQREGVDESEAQMEARLQQWSRENLIEQVVLRQAALADSEPIAPEIWRAALEQLERQSGDNQQFQEHMKASPEMRAAIERDLEIRLKVERYIARLTKKVAPPKTRDIAEFYRKHREYFIRPEQVRARHIVKHTTSEMSEEERRAAEEATRAAQAELLAGVPFAEVADRLSDCQGNGGDLGTFPRGEMVERFEEVIFAMQPGQVSDVFETEFGFHIARLDERIPESQVPLSEVSDQIAERLLSEKRERVLEDHLDRLMAKATIEDAPEPEPVVTPDGGQP